ncbi:MAG TPA: macro domain-containing protein [Candidatus Acidoferrales bacterium]|nr:macro domain-containing protein [Candidatus Acidoferrales bacterium]
MTVMIKSGDLLKENSEAIVNTVNCVGVMGKGIALQFKQRWPQNFEAYAAACDRKEIRPGKMFIYDSGEWARPRFIINFPTKVHWRGDSKIEYIEKGLSDLVLQVERLGIKNIALPPLGCGNGGLDWNDVKRLVLIAFEGHGQVHVDLFEPKGAPPPQEMLNRTEKPRMTPVRAAIVKVISIYLEMEYALSKIEIQKLAYFLEEAGQPLKLDFVKHNYGPYSDKLRHVLKAMDGHYIAGVGDFSADSEIAVIPGALAEADNFIQTSNDDELAEHVRRVARLIEGFETPYGMELLATVHWVATRESGVRTVDDATVAVHNWNARKRAILSKEHIQLAWQRLSGEGWFRGYNHAKKGRLSFQ